MGTPLNRDDFSHAFEALQASLRKDRLFAGGKLPELKRLVDGAPATWELFFGKALAGWDDVYRYAALVLAARVFRGSRQRWSGAQKPRAGQTIFFPGDAVIRGNLVLPTNAVVVAAGNLSVEGTLASEASADYSFVGSGGTLSAKNLFVTGELMSAAAVRVKDAAYLQGNDFGSFAPRIEAKVLLQDDRGDCFGKIRAARRWDGSLDHRTVKKLLSWVPLGAVETPEEFVDALRSWMVSGKAPPIRKPTNTKLQEQLLLAARDGATGRVKSLLERGADPNGPGGYPSFQNACLDDYVGVLRLLIEHGLNVNWKLRDDSSCLAYAAGGGNTTIVRELLKAGADPNLAAEPSGHVPLHSAAQYGRTGIVKLLLAAGAEPNRPAGRQGITPLQIAKDRGFKKIVDLLRRAARR